MKAENLNLALWQAIKGIVFQGCQKVHFLIFSVFGLVCYFACYCGIILVS
jgi:hypothetical protein